MASYMNKDNTNVNSTYFAMTLIATRSPVVRDRPLRTLAKLPLYSQKAEPGHSWITNYLLAYHAFDLVVGFDVWRIDAGGRWLWAHRRVLIRLSLNHCVYLALVARCSDKKLVGFSSSIIKTEKFNNWPNSKSDNSHKLTTSKNFKWKNWRTYIIHH